MTGYKSLDSSPKLSEIQAEMLKSWKLDKVFEKSVRNGQTEEVVFYDGPPFPTGIPHHGTVLVSFIKDMIARYHTMQGYSVPRVWGWDCHGLPIETQAEKALGIDSKTEIERTIGIGKFNEACHEIVSRNNETWREYVDQMARWVDYDGAYKTMNLSYMESVMWAFKQCYDKGLIYRDYRVTPYCCRCETSLSISDTRESDSTRPRQDRWIIAKFKTDEQIDGKQVYFLAWTTTPWTLPSNLCLAVGENLTYAYVAVEDMVFIACKDTLKSFPKVFGKKPEILKEVKGSELVGKTYTPLFPYFANMAEQGAFRVVTADYVGSDEGVGIVHTAPAFGEDDYWTCRRNNIPMVNPVDGKGHFTKEVTDFYTDTDAKTVIEMNPTVIRFLYDNGLAVADGTIEHNYPHCWRCREPLIYKAMDAWYLNIEKLKPRLIELNNTQVNWVPDSVKDSRFGKWLENARDWNISRNRYWSTPIPIWECPECGERVVLGSLDEIAEKSGKRLDNLHRQFVDEVTFPCKCGATMHRVPEVLDCWFESGCVPFAQKHYPFENKEWFESHFPCDFIVEYTGQIRCWFYYLHVMATALFDRPAFKNCVVHGTILDENGKKLSKSNHNYTDPMELMKQFGTDAFRLYLFQSNAMLVGDLRFKDSGIKDMLQQLILPLWNACNFFISYANIDGYHPETMPQPKSDNQLDQWILALLADTERRIRDNMSRYEVNHFTDQLDALMDGLTNWFIRRSRRRFWGKEMTADKQSAYDTLYYVLVNTLKLFAPVAPILSDYLYRILTGEESVHLTRWPEIPQEYVNDGLLHEIALTRNVIPLAHALRSKNNIKIRQPLSTLRVALVSADAANTVRQFTDIIAEELNVKNVEIVDDVSAIASVQYAPNFNAIRDLYRDRVPVLIKAIKTNAFKLTEDAAVLTIDGQEESFDPEIILVTYQAKDGGHIMSEHGIVVSLDLTITEELKAEGLARDIVRNIQDARKQSGLEISDRIIIQISGAYPENYADYICGETLGTLGTAASPLTTLTVESDQGDITIAIAKA
ncbi:MAG: isoleucine--tRNA ligase [Oscillospiraceae bacterium]|nr:isoleucine--tRNA ligase [Oscillospiraceae bacterium]